MFDVTMYTTEMENVLTPTSCFNILNFYSLNESDSQLSSSLEIASLLKWIASISLPKLHTHPIITQNFDACNQDHY